MSASIPPRIENTPVHRGVDLTAVMPDFPFNYARFLGDAKTAKAPPFKLDAPVSGKVIAIIGGGISGIVAGYELLRAGFAPVIFEGGGRIGGRMHSVPLGGKAIAEMGAMRFPPSCKTLFHYFAKTGMTDKMAPFPNPATNASPGTVVNYKGVSDYFDVSDSRFPLPKKYADLSKKWNAFMEAAPIRLTEMQKYLEDPDANWKAIKTLWNGHLTQRDWDNLSFHRALVDAKWSAEEIELFGQVGFGSGGWNTNYVNCFLELLRVAYTAMESDHQLCFQGADTLPKTLYSSTPHQLNDPSADVTARMSLEATTRAYFMTLGITDVLHNAVHDIAFDEKEDKYTISFSARSGEKTAKVDGIVFTPHVRVLQMMGSDAKAQVGTRALFDNETWEAIEYTHYMQSSKTFMKPSSVFWKNKGPDGKHPMSVTLSDRLTRGTYLLDYSGDGAICLTYTWNDDALKFLPFEVKGRAARAISVIKDIYPDLQFDKYVTDRVETVSWENEQYYIGAFKNNLPGHYRYQRILYAQFVEGKTKAQKRLILAGDDVSWTGGWAEGAITTGLNAAHAIVKAFGGSAFEKRGPIDRWEEMKPIALK